MLLRTFFACVLAVAAMPLAAQQPEPPAQELVRKAVVLRHVVPENLWEVLRNWVGVLSYSQDLGVVSLVGTPEQVQDAEAAIRMIDAPERAKKNVELTVYFLGAMDGAGEDLSQTAVGPVVAQLREQFPYSGYRLLETFLVRAREGTETRTSGVFEAEVGGGEEMISYEFSALIQDVRGDPAVISIGDLQCRWREPMRGEEGKVVGYENLGVQSNIDVPANKLVVVGKAGGHGPTRGLFVVIRARVAE